MSKYLDDIFRFDVVCTIAIINIQLYLQIQKYTKIFYLMCTKCFQNMFQSSMLKLLMCATANRNPVIISHRNISNAIFAQNHNVIASLRHTRFECCFSSNFPQIQHDICRPCNPIFVWMAKKLTHSNEIAEKIIYLFVVSHLVAERE